MLSVTAHGDTQTTAYLRRTRQQAKCEDLMHFALDLAVCSLMESGFSSEEREEHGFRHWEIGECFTDLTF